MTKYSSSSTKYHSKKVIKSTSSSNKQRCKILKPIVFFIAVALDFNKSQLSVSCSFFYGMPYAFVSLYCEILGLCGAQGLGAWVKAVYPSRLSVICNLKNYELMFNQQLCWNLLVFSALVQNRTQLGVILYPLEAILHYTPSSAESTLDSFQRQVKCFN